MGDDLAFEAIWRAISGEREVLRDDSEEVQDVVGDLFRLAKFAPPPPEGEAAGWEELFPFPDVADGADKAVTGDLTKRSSRLGLVRAERVVLDGETWIDFFSADGVCTSSRPEKLVSQGE